MRRFGIDTIMFFKILAFIWVMGFSLSTSSSRADVLEEGLQERLRTGDAESKAFLPGEYLEYSLSWFGIPAGTASLQISELMKLEGREVYRVTSTARSNDFISFFYPVEDRIDSFVDADGLYPHQIVIRQREGKRKRDREVRFDQVNHRAVQVNEQGEKVFPIPAEVQDTLSCLYYLRTRSRLVPGESVFIDVHEGEKNFQLEVKILTRERIATPLGSFQSLKVKALMRFEGIFMDRGEIYVWLTDDDRRIPVMMQSKIKVGSVSAKLVSKREGTPLTVEVSP